MKELVQSIYTNPKYVKFFEWGKLISITGSTQVLVQAIGFLSGIMVIRLLPAYEYGLYTLANSMLGTMALLADGGVSNSVMSQGGKVWQDREKLGSVLVTGYNLRKKFAIASLLVSTPFLLYLLKHQNASWLASILIVVSLAPTFFTSLSANLLPVGPSLHQKVALLQKNQIAVNILRLVMLVLTLFVFPWAFVAILATGLPQFWGNIRLRKIANVYADWEKKPDIEIQKKIIKFVKRTLPGTIYYCLSGQVSIWLISYFGSTEAIAQVGALGRIGIILTGFCTAMFGILIVPRFSRLSEDKKILLKRFLQLLLCLFALSACILIIVWLFPSEVLWILGKNYSNLETELLLSICGSCLLFIAASSYSISTSRSWVINPVISIPVTIAAIVFGAIFIDISTLKGALIFNLFIASVEMVMHISYCSLRIMKVEKY